MSLNSRVYEWILINSLVRTTEIQFVFCQSLAFLRLSIKLNLADEQGSTSDAMLRSQDAYYTQMTSRVLIGVLSSINTLFLIYIVCLISVDVEEEEEASNDNYHMLGLQIFCWILGLVSTVFLLVTIVYTLVKLKKMYPNDNPEV